MSIVLPANWLFAWCAIFVMACLFDLYRYARNYFGRKRVWQRRYKKHQRNPLYNIRDHEGGPFV